jgi:site-specific recombinase XerD
MIKIVTISKIEHNERSQILLRFDYSIDTIAKIKSLPHVKYSKTYKGWYIEYSKESWAAFGKLGLEYAIEKSTYTDIKNNENTLENKIDPSGTAVSPMNSDIAGIATDKQAVATTVHPSHGDSKGTDIHQVKGGRSIAYNGGRFYITIHYNEDDIKLLKSLKGFWQSKIKKWIVKATMENLEIIQQKYKMWDDAKYESVKELIMNVECPYLVTLYRTPEATDMVMVQIIGHKANTSIVKNTIDRSYQKDEKRWTIPNDAVIIQRLKDDYIRDGAQVIDRLPQLGFDYHKKEESYGQYKVRYLSKTEAELKPIVERYIDTLIAFKRSKKTMTTYLGPFIKFVKQIGIDAIDTIGSKDIDKYMSMISREKVSDGYLHNAFNAILFYYRDVLRTNERVVKEARRPKKDDTLPAILSLGEVDRILRSMENLKHTTVLYTFYSSGMRLNEILHLRIEDIWWERDQIMVKGGKGKKDRIVPLSAILKDLFKVYFEEYKPIYWLFEGFDKKLPYSERSVQKVVKQAVKKAGVSKTVTPHTMRHCYATHLLDGGTDIKYIQELLGHRDIKTTLIYTHVTNHSLSKIQSPLDKLMMGKKDNIK